MKAKHFLLMGTISTITASTFLFGINAKKVNSALMVELSDSKEAQRILEERLENTNAVNGYLKEEIERLEGIRKEIQQDYDSLIEKYQAEISQVSYNKNNLKSPSRATVAKLKKALEGTGLSGLEESYIKAEKEYGVNAIFLVALTAEESGWGRSKRAIYQNNMSGFEVYSDDAKGASFSSKDESIQVTAKLLSRDYLSPDGKYHLGYSIYDVNKNYCPVNGTTWSENISKIANELIKKINSR